MSAVYKATEVADLFGVSEWALYEAVKRGDVPIPPIRIGRRMVWPKARVDQLLGLGKSEGSGHHPEPNATTVITSDPITDLKGKAHAT